MKTKILFLFTLALAMHSCFAQRLVLDTTFKPFFDIRPKQFSGKINDIWENPITGKTWIAGGFNFHVGAVLHGSLTSLNRDGDRNTSFKGSGSITSGIRFFPINDTAHVFVLGTVYDVMDSTGVAKGDWVHWRSNVRNTVPCRRGIPYFFKNGSSLMANRFGNLKGCHIKAPPDTLEHRFLIKVDSLGFWDSTFTHETNNRVEGFLPYDSNRIWVFGLESLFTMYDSTAVNGLCRINLDGNLDTTFHNPLYNFGNPANFNIYVISETEKNGKFFLLGSFFLKSDSTTRVAIARFHPNGDLDTTFSYQNDVQDTIIGLGGFQTICKMPDGGYLAGGRFNKFQGHAVNSLVKLDSVGNLEPNYIQFRGADSSHLNGNNEQFILKIIASKFGGYYVVGDFFKWNNQASQPIVRLLIDSTVGLDEEKEKQRDKVNIYPNPTKGLLNLNLLNGEQLKGLQLFDLLGKEQNIPLKNRQLDLSSLSKGIYFLQLQLSSGELLSKKIIKH